MAAYYNENDPKAAAWLRELIAAELIPKGLVGVASPRKCTCTTSKTSRNWKLFNIPAGSAGKLTEMGGYRSATKG